jgi:hypothetical protein
MLAAALGLLKRVVANAPKARKPGPKPGTPRPPRAPKPAAVVEPEPAELPAPEPEDPEADIKAEAFATLPPGNEPAPRFDPDQTLSFPKIVLDGSGNLVSPLTNGHAKK